MGWAETRQAARADVHSQFAFDGRYFSALGVGIGVPVSVRVHSKVINQGDLTNLGYPQSTDDTIRCVFLAADVQRIGIKQKGVVSIPSLSLTVRLQVRNAELTDPSYIEYAAVSV